MSRVHAKMEHSLREVSRPGVWAPHSLESGALVGIPPQASESGSIDACGAASRRSEFSNDDTVASARGGPAKHRDTQ